MTPENYRSRCDALLLALLGSRELVQRWWHSPNLNWQLETPENIFKNNPQQVYTYLLAYYDS